MIQRYTLLKMLSATALITLGFWVFFSVIGFAQEAESIGNHHYSALFAFLYSLLSAFTSLSDILPIIGLFSFLMVYGSLAASNELIALQALGTSYQRLTLTACVACMSSFLCLFALIELSGPPVERFADHLKSRLLNQTTSLTTNQDVWLKEKNRFVFIKHLMSQDKAEQLSLYELDSKMRFKRILQAQSADRVEHNQWQLNSVNEQLFHYGSTIKATRIEKHFHRHLIHPSFISAQQSERLNQQPTQMNLGQLYLSLKQLEANDLTNKHYTLNFWTRILAPLVMIGFMLFTLPLFLGSTRHTSASERMVVGLMFALPYFVLQHLSQQATIAYDLPALLMAFSMPSLIILMGLLRYYWSVKN